MGGARKVRVTGKASVCRCVVGGEVHGRNQMRSGGAGLLAAAQRNVSKAATVAWRRGGGDGGC